MGKAGTAVVTGAAGGLGQVFAERLAGKGFSLLVIDKNPEGLINVATRLRRGGADVRYIVADLANAGEVQGVADVLEAATDVSLLINNAAFGLVCKFQSVDLPRVLDMIQIHIVASLSFCRAVLPAMIASGKGSIINVASAGAFMRFPRDAAYISSKAYLVAFTECLALDLVGTGVSVQALCPGWITTDFVCGSDLTTAGYKPPFPKWLYVSPESVVDSSLGALARGPVIHIPTLKARLAVAFIGSTSGRWLLANMRKLGMGQGTMPGD